MTAISVIGIVIALIFCNYSVYRGLGLALAAVFSCFIIWITGGVSISAGWDSAITELEPYLGAMIPIYIFGGILGLFYAKSGAAASLSLACFRPFKNAKNPKVKMLGTIFMFFIMRVLLTLSGIDNMALIVTTVAMVAVMCEELDIPRKYANCLLMISGTIPTFMPGAPTMMNVILPTALPGFTRMSCFVPRLLFMFAFIILSTLMVSSMIRRSKDKGAHYEAIPGMDAGELTDENVKRPFWLLTLVPLVVVYILSVVTAISSWICIMIGCIVAGVLFVPYMKVPEGQKRFGWLINEMNDASIQIPLYYCMDMMLAYAMVSVPGWAALTNWMGTLATVLHPALAYGIVSTLLVPAGVSAVVISANLATEIFIPMGLSAATCGTLLVVSNTVLANLPNSCGMIMQAELTETPLREGYPSIFKTTVLLTGAIMAVATVMAMVGIM